MSSDLQIRFQLGVHNHEVDFNAQDNIDKNSVLIDGISYCLKGRKEAISFIKKCLENITQEFHFKASGKRAKSQATASRCKRN